MAKSKRIRRAKNKITGSTDGALVKADAYVEPAIVVHRPAPIRIARDPLFTAELEEVIEIIAKDRVYRAMLARLGRRLLLPSPADGDIFDA
jgi:hypothetical protein